MFYTLFVQKYNFSLTAAFEISWRPFRDALWWQIDVRPFSVSTCQYHHALVSVPARKGFPSLVWKAPTAASSNTILWNQNTTCRPDIYHPAAALDLTVSVGAKNLGESVKPQELRLNSHCFWTETLNKWRGASTVGFLSKGINRRDSRRLPDKTGAPPFCSRASTYPLCQVSFIHAARLNQSAKQSRR